MHTLGGLLVGLIAGYAFRGFWHRELLKYGARLKDAARRGGTSLENEAKTIVIELKARL